MASSVVSKEATVTPGCLACSRGRQRAAGSTREVKQGGQSVCRPWCVCLLQTDCLCHLPSVAAQAAAACHAKQSMGHTQIPRPSGPAAFWSSPHWRGPPTCSSSTSGAIILHLLHQGAQNFTTTLLPAGARRCMSDGRQAGIRMASRLRHGRQALMRRGPVHATSIHPGSSRWQMAESTHQS